MTNAQEAFVLHKAMSHVVQASLQTNAVYAERGINGAMPSEMEPSASQSLLAHRRSA